MCGYNSIIIIIKTVAYNRWQFTDGTVWNASVCVSNDDDDDEVDYCWSIFSGLKSSTTAKSVEQMNISSS